MKFASALIATSLFFFGSFSFSAPLCAGLFKSSTGLRAIEIENDSVLRALDILKNKGQQTLQFLGEYSAGQRPTQKMTKFKGQFRNDKGMIVNMIVEIYSEKGEDSKWHEGEPILTVYPILFERGQQLVLKRDQVIEDSGLLGPRSFGRPHYSIQVSGSNGALMTVLIARNLENESGLLMRVVGWN